MVTEALDVPLVVDLDGTLLATDVLQEALLDVTRTNPCALWRLPFIAFSGRAAVTEYLAASSKIDVETWPAREDLVSLMREQATAGRRIVLVTSASRQIGEAVARRFGFISEVIAADADCDMTGEARAERLCRAFPGGFIYAGSSADDLPVWQHSRESVLVDTPGRVADRARLIREPVAEFAQNPSVLRPLLRSLRLHQWAKNALVLVPLILGGKATDPAAWIAGALGFLALGLAASATYIINDLWDLPNDRRHWSKRTRPLASGALSIGSGLSIAATLLLAAFALAAWLGPTPLAVLGIYVAMTLSYSFALKRVPMLDVFMLASLFTIRLGLGIALTDVRLSPWLMVFSMFVFLSLSMAKRHTEVLRMTEHGHSTIRGRGYVAGDAPLTLGCGLASMFSAVFILILYLIEDAFPQDFYARPALLWLAPAILFLFLGRIWLLCQRGQLHDDPVAFALKDRASLALGAVMAVAVVLAVVGFGRG